MDPHPAYVAEDMPARQLERYVRMGLKSGLGIKPVALAEVLFKVASRGEKVPLWLPLGSTAEKLIRSKLEKRLESLDAVKDLTFID